MTKHGTVIDAIATYTGGGIYRYTARTTEDKWLLGNSEWDCVYLVDVDPDEDERSWYDEWFDDHVVETLEDEDYYSALEDMLGWIIRNQPDGNYSSLEIEHILESELANRKDPEEETGERLVSMQEFIDIYNAAVTLMFAEVGNADDMIYGKPLTIHWNGIYCDCGTGATIANNIIPGIEGVISEEGG